MLCRESGDSGSQWTTFLCKELRREWFGGQDIEGHRWEMRPAGETGDSTWRALGGKSRKGALFARPKESWRASERR